jgi:hypothetical protein
MFWDNKLQLENECFLSNNKTFFLIKKKPSIYSYSIFELNKLLFYINSISKFSLVNNKWLRCLIMKLNNYTRLGTQHKRKTSSFFYIFIYTKKNPNILSIENILEHIKYWKKILSKDIVDIISWIFDNNIKNSAKRWNLKFFVYSVNILNASFRYLSIKKKRLCNSLFIFKKKITIIF